jgi:F5/8 type C domain
MRRPSVAFGLAAGLYFLLTIALTWPLALHLGSRVPNDLGDSLLNMFIVDWNARQLPLTDRWWSQPQFYPIPGVLTFSEHLLGLAPITTPIILTTGNAVIAYNVAFFLSFPLCALAAHFLVYQITGRHDVAVIGGLAYGFAPYRMAQFAHVQVLSSYWIPLALGGLHLFVQRRQKRGLVLFAVAWYFQALACGYYLFYLSVLVGLWLLWFAVGRIRAADIGRIALAWGVAILAIVPVALGYLKYSRMYALKRWPDEIQAFSADIASLLRASPNLRVWGWLNVIDRPESALFPGLALVAVILTGVMLAWSAAAHESLQRLRAPRILLALAAFFGIIAASPLWFGAWKVEIFGLKLVSVTTPQKPLSVAVLLAVIAFAMHPSIRAGWRRRSPLAFYTLAAIVMWLFSLGPAPTLMGEPMLYKAPYSWLLMLPGVDGVRVPARFWVLATACLSVAVALAVRQLAQRWPNARMALVATCAGVLLLESWPRALILLPPPALRPSHTRAVARLELPQTSASDLVALYRATEHHRPLINGYSGYFAPHYGALQDLLDRRDPDVLGHLASLGAIEIVVDHAADPGGAWRRFVAAQPYVEIAHHEPDYTTFRLPAQSRGRVQLPRFTAPPVRVERIDATANQDRVGRMTDGDLMSRWDTAGPQEPSNAVVLDLGRPTRLQGIELLIAGYRADFPRQLVVELSDDGKNWDTAWAGRTALLALTAALEAPLTEPLGIPLGDRIARHIRLRQTSSDRIYYWSIAELHIYGEPAPAP